MKYILLLFTSLAANLAPAQNLKTLTPITGANVADADYVPLIDVSADGLKSLTLPELWKKLGGTNVSATELGYLDGVSSGIQNQLDKKSIKMARQLFVADYGARGDGVTLYDGVFTSGSTGFTSATAAFTAADVGKSIVLQLSQGVRQILTIASVTNGTTIVMSGNASGYSSSYTYGITTYGRDNTSAIQAAIDVAGVGGGEVLFDGGIYLCTGAAGGAANSIFKLPYATTTIGAAPSIKLTGVGSPNFAFFNPGQRPTVSGTVIYCPNQTTVGYEDGTAYDPAIFAVVPRDFTPPGGAVPNAASYWGSVPTMTTYENLTLRQVPATKLHALQHHLGGGLLVEKCVFDLDVPYTSSVNQTINPAKNPVTGLGDRFDPIPNAAGGDRNSTAIIPPSKLSAYWSHINQVVIYGYAVGVRFTDSVRLDQMVFDICALAMRGTANHASEPVFTNGMSAGQVFVNRCRTILEGDFKCDIQYLNYERATGPEVPTWATNNVDADIDNAYGKIRGKINIFVVNGGSGAVAAVVRAPEVPRQETLIVHDLVTGRTLGNFFPESITITPTTASPAAPTLSTVGSAGSTTYKYRIGYIMPDKSELLGPEATITTGNSTLNNTNKINISPIPLIAGSRSYRVYRTFGGATQGYIFATFGPPTSGQTFAYDTGQAGDGTIPVDTTGRINFAAGGNWNGSTINGPQAFASSARPTSAGTGLPAATSLITAGDAAIQQFFSPVKDINTAQGQAFGNNNTYLRESAGAAQLSINNVASALCGVYFRAPAVSIPGEYGADFGRRMVWSISTTNDNTTSVATGKRFYAQFGRGVGTSTFAKLATHKGFGITLLGSTVTPYVCNGSVTTDGATFSWFTYPRIILDFQPGVGLLIYGINEKTNSTPVLITTISTNIPTGKSAIYGAEGQLEFMYGDTGSGGGGDTFFLLGPTCFGVF